MGILFTVDIPNPRCNYPPKKLCPYIQGLNIGGFSDSVFNVISAFLADNNQRFVAEVEAIEL